MTLSQEQVVFTVHPPVEFIYALHFLANEEFLYKFYQEFDFTPSEAFKDFTVEMKGRLSRFLQSELTYFFKWPDMEHILGRILLENEAVKCVPDFITLMEQIPAKELQFYMIGEALYGESTSDENRVRWKAEAPTADKLKQLVSDIDNKADEDMEKLMECAENPREIKSRLCFLLARFYEKCYGPVEGKILAELSAAKERYDGMFRARPDYFNAEYLGRILDSGYGKFIIHISFFTQIRVRIFNVKPRGDIRLISLGIHSEHYPRKTFIKSKVQKFVKILSDAKRFEIVRRLGKRPHYVHELSTGLKLTPPTVCYHLNTMLELNLVSLERENNKTFYSLNKATVRELLDNASEILLEDHE